MLPLHLLQNARILIVDDQERNLTLLDKMLRGAGYAKLRLVSNPVEAIGIYSEYRPDLILLDINMPEMTGFQVMEQLKLRRDPSGDDYLPVLILTADFEQATRLRALEAGAKDFLNKPFDRLEVLARVRNLLEVRLLHNLLREKNREAEDLLLNILPKPVADELRAKGVYRPVRHEEVTVLFTDFLDFTRAAEAMEPGALVEELEACFTAFDAIADRWRLEKLKTIGDAYMMAGGIPAPSRTHAVDCVLAGLEIQRFMTRRLAERGAAGGRAWALRVGVHSGPVMAGVIGRRKFAYDVWGDTVNVASRMESSGAPGRVNLSSATHERVKDFIACESRGKVGVKSKGEVEMYFAVGLRPELSEGGQGMEPNAAFREKYERLRSA